MASDSRLSTPIAILAGSVIIAAAILIGLRRAPEAPLPQPAAPSSAPAPPPAKPQVDREAVAKEVDAALSRVRKALADKCVPKGVTPTSDAPLFKCVFDFTFDAEGRQIVRGILVDRATMRPEMTPCVTENLPPLSITPRGQSVRIEAPFALP
jgi:hypothetical protein